MSIKVAIAVAVDGIVSPTDASIQRESVAKSTSLIVNLPYLSSVIPIEFILSLV